VTTAYQAKDVDLARVRRRSPEVESVDGHPVETLVTASMYADLLVVGSRGLHGLRALGSVSERVAHEAKSSVLVVRSS
jgi:nucleotide-binding universal stress UspA family protein